MKENNIEVIECSVQTHPYYIPSLGLFKKLMRNYIQLYKKLKKINFDVLFLPYPSHRYIPLGLFLSFKKPIIFDPFVSLYNTFVQDHKDLNPNSIQAHFLYYYEKICMKIPNITLFDTKSHRIYFQKFFKLKGFNFKTLYLGADNKIFFPRKEEHPQDKFMVGFYGTYIPLQGIKYIIDAAKILENNKEIFFEIIGGATDNPYYNKMMEYFKKKKHTNVKLIPHVSLSDLAVLISKSDIQLGIFGKTPKTNIVIPNKVYTAIAMKKPIISANTLAINEVFTEKKDIFLCEPANSKSLVDSILMAYEDDSLRNKIAANAYKLYLKEFTPEKIGKNYLKILYNYLLN